MPVNFQAVTFDGEKVIGEIKDLGKRSRKQRSGERFSCYTTKITINGRSRYSRVDANLVDKAAVPNEFRMSEDDAMIESFGIDSTTIYIKGPI